MVAVRQPKVKGTDLFAIECAANTLQLAFPHDGHLLRTRRRHTRHTQDGKEQE
jgi:hypothetical protein